MDRFRLDDPDAAEKAPPDCPCRTAESREAAMVVLSERVWCDPCLVPLIRALNDGGLPTVASCCGHGHRPGWIALSDGRILMALPDLGTLHAVERATHALFPLDINGDAIEQPRLPTRSQVAEAVDVIRPAARLWLVDWLDSAPDLRECDGPRDCSGTERGCRHCTPGEFATLFSVMADLVRATEDPEPEVDPGQALLNLLREARDELNRWGHGDFHYGETAQEESVVSMVRRIDDVLASWQGAGDPPMTPPHDIIVYGPMSEGERTISGGTYPMSGYGWTCSCGQSGFGYASEDDAGEWASRHEVQVTP